MDSQEAFEERKARCEKRRYHRININSRLLSQVTCYDCGRYYNREDIDYEFISLRVKTHLLR